MLMTTAAFLFTGCALICALVAFVAARQCRVHEDNMHRAMGRLSAVEAEAAQLTSQIMKLRQKLYYRDHREKHDEPSESAVCENYARAQLEGPLSKAAKCDCTYCFERRQARKSPAPALLR
jgi:hypothetical protein